MLIFPVLVALCISSVWSKGFVQTVTLSQCFESSNSDTSFLLCGICATPSLKIGLTSMEQVKYCSDIDVLNSLQSEVIVSAATNAVLNSSATMLGFYFNSPGTESNSTECLSYLLAHAPRRDLNLLFTETSSFLLYILNHVRWAIRTRETWTNVPWNIFLEYVLPYAVLDEPRDITYDWRSRYHQLFSASVLAAQNGSTDLLTAATTLSTLIPYAQPNGVLALQDVDISGEYVTWHSSSSPGILSPQQVGTFGGSCTGTGILMVLAARSVGLPARLVGCSQSITDDDHHWVEFWTDETSGPFGDGWHTREGTSNGNPDGPWDSPSGPMTTCLQYLQPGNDLNTIWATSWSSSTFLPVLWSPDNQFNRQYAFKGGDNRCGAYCSAWGCGTDSAFKYTQEECGMKR